MLWGNKLFWNVIATLKWYSINIKTWTMIFNSVLWTKELCGAVSEESALPDDLLTAEGPALPDSFTVKFKTNCIFILWTNPCLILFHYRDVDFVNKYRTDIMQVLSCENYQIPAIMSWPFFFPLISLEVCLHQCWICSSGFYPSVLIQPCRLHNQVTIFAMLAAFCSVLKIGSTWLSGMLKCGKDSIFKLRKEKKSFTHY